MMQQMQHDQLYLVELPIRLEVHSSLDGICVSKVEQSIRVILYGDRIKELRKDLATQDRPIHSEQKNNASAYVRRELLPQEPPESPIHLPDTWVEVIIKGDISTWKVTPYSKESATLTGR